MTDLQFEPVSHAYTFNGQRVPSVTTIIRSLIDYSLVPPDMLDHKRDIGTAAHLATELWDLGDLNEEALDPQVAPYLEAWQRFRAESGFAVVEMEQRIYHPTYHYAGTLDRVGKMGSGPLSHLAIFEIKTTAQIHDAYVGAQTAAYFRAYNHGRPRAECARKRYAVHLKRDGTYALHDYPDHSADFAVFLD